VAGPCGQTLTQKRRPGVRRSGTIKQVPVADGKDSSRSALSGLLLVLGSIGGLALLVWLTLVMLDLKHLNTSGFTLP
jgi:hypothetical protein